uniref:Uncharacterized protein n=1 Tax=Haemonchus contortus TaxID=6289 RepID=A0A7I4YLW6_HAECO
MARAGPLARSPLSEKSALMVRNANYMCRCHEMKPYDVCNLSTTLESEDVLSIRSSESEQSSDDDHATKEVMLNMSPTTNNAEDSARVTKK